MSNPVTRVGTVLPDSEMKLYDRKLQKKVSVNWREKDRPLSRIMTPLRQKAGTWEVYTDHIIPELTPIGNQGQAGSCVANAWCDALEILDGLEGKDQVEQLSRRFLYWVARYLTGDTAEDAGTFLRSAAHQLKNLGVVEEKYFEYSDHPSYITGEHASPELDLYTMASNNRIAGFYQAEALNPDQYLRELEIAVRGNHPYVFGTPVSQAFANYRGGGVTFGPPKESESIGGHAMICVGIGYDDETRWWWWRNSWGLNWGDNGHVKVNDEYVLACRDVWIGTKMQELI